jgi:hypothetical protein
MKSLARLTARTWRERCVPTSRTSFQLESALPIAHHSDPFRIPVKSVFVCIGVHLWLHLRVPVKFSPSMPVKFSPSGG